MGIWNGIPVGSPVGESLDKADKIRKALIQPAKMFITTEES